MHRFTLHRVRHTHAERRHRRGIGARRAAYHLLDRGEQRNRLLRVVDRMPVGQPPAHIGEHRGRAGERLGHSRDQSLECIRLKIAEALFVCTRERQLLPRAAALSARRVPRGLLGDRERIEHGGEFAERPDMRRNGREGRIVRCR
jgi:hypothetical protein